MVQAVITHFLKIDRNVFSCEPSLARGFSSETCSDPAEGRPADIVMTLLEPRLGAAAGLYCQEGSTRAPPYHERIK